MASPASTSHSSLDDAAHALPELQSTKERRRERNRLAAQKHRLRRNERMNQLEQQVLALQQEKSILLARLHNEPLPSSSGSSSSVHAPPTPPSSAGGSAHSDDQDDDADVDPDADDDLPPPSSTTTIKRQQRALLLAPEQQQQQQQHTLPPIDDALAHHSTRDAAYTRQLEDRIVELERWTEDLNGELADALDSHARIADDLHRRCRRTHDQFSRADQQRAHAQREADDLRAVLDARADDERAAQRAAQALREELEGVEVALDLQRHENDRLRERLARADEEAAREGKHLYRELYDARAALDRLEDENRRWRELHREREGSAELSRKRKHEEVEDASSLSSRLSHTESLLVTQKRQLQHAQSQVEERDVDGRRLNKRVSYLQNALGKAHEYLTSQGVPLDFDDSDD